MSHRALTAILLSAAACVAGCDKPSADAGDGAPVAEKSSEARDALIQQAADAAAEANDSPLVFDKYEHDFGRILDTEKVSAVYKFTVVGDEPIKLGRPQASCGCTVPTLEKNEYAPGETGSIDVTFSPKGAGQTTKHITIPIEGKQPVRLAISANVVPILSVDPRGVSFINVKRGAEMIVPVVVRARDPQVRIVSVTPVEGRVKILIDDPGSKTDDADLPGTASFRVVLPEDTPVGIVSDKLMLKVLAAAAEGEEQQEQNIQLNVSGRVKGDLFTQPPALNIPAKGPGEEFETALLVRSLDNAEFNIKSVEIRNANFEGVTAEYDVYEFAGDRSYRVTLRGTMPETVGKMLSGVLVVTTDVPGEETLEVTFRGRVQSVGGPTPVGGPRPQ